MGTALLLVGLLLGCGDDAPLSPGPSDALDQLLATPRSEEIATVLADLALRTPAGSASDLSVLETRSETFADLSLVSYPSEGRLQYGVVATPKTAGPFPILLYNHGGDGGLSPEELDHPLAAAFVQVAPSFRSEPVRWYGTNYTSEGDASPWDRDVDDALNLFACARDLPQVDEGRAIALGASRGGGVSLLAAARHPEWFQAVVDVYGPTDLFDPVWRPIADSLAAGGTDPRPGMDFFRNEVLVPYLAGSLSLAGARSELIRRSSLYFADRLPPTQIHHGDADLVVPPSQSARLADRLQSLGRSFEYFVYPAAGHTFPLGPEQIPRMLLFVNDHVQAAG